MAWQRRTLGDQYTPSWDPSSGSYYYDDATGAISMSPPPGYDPYAQLKSQGVSVDTSTSNPSYSMGGAPGYMVNGSFVSAADAQNILKDPTNPQYAAVNEAASSQGRNPSSGGFLGAMGLGDLALAGGMALGGYGLGSALGGLGAGAPITSAASGAAGGGGVSSFNLFDPSTWFSGGTDLTGGANGLTGPLQGTVNYTSGGVPMDFGAGGGGTPFDFSGGGLGGLGGLGSGLGSLLSNPALLGAGAGALLGGLGGTQKPAGNITTVQDVPDWVKPYLVNNLNSAGSVMNLANSGNSLLPAAEAQIASTINGNYLNPNTNPALAPYLKDIAGQTGSYFTGMYGGPAGTNLGNSGFQEALSRGITGAVAGPEFQAYNAERGNQINAAGGVPAFAGQTAQSSFAPFTAFNSLIPGLRTQSQPYFNNAFSNAASGALGGFALGKALG